MTHHLFVILAIWVMALILTSCGGDASVDTSIGIYAAVSECGGFDGINIPTRLRSPTPEPNNDSGTSYGDTEEDEIECVVEDAIEWQYDTESGLLTITNFNSYINCCGVHEVTIEHFDTTGTYKMTETDAPVPLEGRCGCMCLFDWRISVQVAEPTIIMLQVVRYITDSIEGKKTIWGGEIDLSEGEGRVVISSIPCDHIG